MDAEEARFVTWPPMRPVEANKDKHRVAELGDVVEDAVKPRTMDIEEKLFVTPRDAFNLAWLSFLLIGAG